LLTKRLADSLTMLAWVGLSYTIMLLGEKSSTAKPIGVFRAVS